jgi:hypothetical protein
MRGHSPIDIAGRLNTRDWELQAFSTIHKRASRIHKVDSNKKKAGRAGDYTVKKVRSFPVPSWDHLPSFPWLGIIKFFPGQEEFDKSHPG